MTAIYKLENLVPGTSILGPAIVIDNTQTLVIIPEAEARILTSHVVININQLSKTVKEEKVGHL